MVVDDINRLLMTYADENNQSHDESIEDEIKFYDKGWIVGVKKVLNQWSSKRRHGKKHLKSRTFNDSTEKKSTGTMQEGMVDEKLTVIDDCDKWYHTLIINKLNDTKYERRWIKYLNCYKWCKVKNNGWVLNELLGLRWMVRKCSRNVICIVWLNGEFVWELRCVWMKIGDVNFEDE